MVRSDFGAQEEEICHYFHVVPFYLPCGNGNPLQYSCLENLMDGGAWWAANHGVAKSQTRLSDFTFTFHFHALEKEMATHSSVLAWRIPGMGNPGRLPSMGSQRVRHDWSDIAAAAGHRSRSWNHKVGVVLWEKEKKGKEFWSKLIVEQAHGKVKKEGKELMKMLVECSDLMEEFYYERYH